ncbi:MAG: DNA mismatch repair protein MutS [Planctomycetota bacterium]|jgi:DNA mismatch repair protein MutS|nr:DNA mismatch repair protein MutS [Planctomycetota bacterium]
MMEQFWRAKKEQPDALLFFRMGDFYELFHEDAQVAARELGITLTSRSKGEGAYAMAGVPVKSVEAYLLRLVRKGFKVAICEQLSDPRTARGIVDRGIVRVVTQGTLTEEDVLDARVNNYLAAVVVAGGTAGIAWVDLSTGRLQVSEVEAAQLLDELGRIAPAELLWSPAADERHPEIAAEVRSQLGAGLSERDPWRFEEECTLRALKKHFGVATLEGFGVDDRSHIVPAAGALIEYLEETQRGACEHVLTMERVESSGLLVLDRATRSCLELVRTQRDGRTEGTLLATIDATSTPMGGRLLRSWVLSPLCEVAPILRRQQGVSELVDQPFLREDVRAHLATVRDIERIVAKVSTGRANGRDLVGLALSLEPVAPLEATLSKVYSAALGELRGELDSLEDVIGQIRTTLGDEPPTGLREGGVIRDGHCERLDELRRIAGDGKSWMARFQAEEAERTGISGLKIGFNSVFGYFIEVPRGQVGEVPEHYIRKQTIKSAERYITPELKEFETEVLKAEETSRDLEYDLFCELREAVAAEVRRILETARAVAEIDVLAALAQHSAENNYTPPVVDEGDVIEINDGRHPVIELAAESEAFVPNDSRLDREGSLVTILTGPNMAGKSTYIRQTALIVLLAQIGSHVPAAGARVGVVDRIFTRIGSADDIGRGASTFMVEMIEIANILNNAGERSLVVLDEVGRGTSTFDGLALAWAIVEHLHEAVGARTMFATHYHQLTDLAQRWSGVCNKTVAVREWEEEILFLHKIVEGGTDRSYGIHVARLAGVPAGVLERARTILVDIEDDAEHLAPRIASKAAGPEEEATAAGQLSLFAAGPSAVERRLAELDPDNLTPLEALNALQALRAMMG